MTISNADIAAQLTGYMGIQTNLLDETRDWLAGAPTGGPGGDGNYPLTRSDGTTVMVACPAKQLDALTEDGITTDILAEAPAAAAGDAGPTNRLIGFTGAGTLKRFAPDIIAIPRIQDIEREMAWQDLLGQILLPSIDAGGNIKAEMNALLRHGTGVVYPSGYPYNMKADVIHVEHVSTTAGSQRVTLPEALVLPDCVGKIVVLTNAAAGGLPFQSTIAAYVNDHQFDMDDPAAFTVPVGGNQGCMWGTDDTQAFRNAALAIKPKGLWTSGGVMLLPPGQFFCKPSAYYARSTIKGHGGRTSMMVRLRDATNPGLPMLYNSTTLDDFPVLKDFAIDGAKFFQFSNNSGGACLQWVSVDGSVATTQSDPYPHFGGIDARQGGYNGFYTYGRFSGDMDDCNAFECNNSGFECHSYDMNVSRMLLIGNQYTGLVCGGESANNNFTAVKASFNGVGALFNASIDRRALGANFWIKGTNHTFENCRGQESATSNLVVESSDCAYATMTLDDTACMGPKHYAGSGYTLPRVCAAVDFKSSLATDNKFTDLKGGSGVHAGSTPDDFASFFAFFSGDASYNVGTMHTKRNTTYIQTGSSAAAPYVPGPYGTDSSGGYGTNQIILDGSLIA